MRRLIISPETVQGDKIHVTDNEDIMYLANVLRMKAGDTLLVSDGIGRAWETIIKNISRDSIELSIFSEQMTDEGTKTRVTLYQGLPKGSKMEEVVRKSTEIGVYSIIPVRTARSIPASGGKSDTKLERWQRIAKEASRQSRRFRIPEVSKITDFEDAVSEIADAEYDLVIILFELEETRTLKQALREYGEKPRNIAVFIGPEGGFELSEVESLVSEGAVSVTIGDTILRTETAGPAAVAMILYELDQ